MSLRLRLCLKKDHDIVDVKFLLRQNHNHIPYHMYTARKPDITVRVKKIYIINFSIHHRAANVLVQLLCTTIAIKILYYHRLAQLLPLN